MCLNSGGSNQIHLKSNFKNRVTTWVKSASYLSNQLKNYKIEITLLQVDYSVHILSKKDLWRNHNIFFPCYRCIIQLIQPIHERFYRNGFWIWQPLWGLFQQTRHWWLGNQERLRRFGRAWLGTRTRNCSGCPPGLQKGQWLCPNN